MHVTELRWSIEAPTFSVGLRSMGAALLNACYLYRQFDLSQSTVCEGSPSSDRLT